MDIYISRSIIYRLRAVSLFFQSVKRYTRDTKRTTRVMKGAFLASRGFASRCSRARAFSVRNLKKRETARSQSIHKPTPRNYSWTDLTCFERTGKRYLHAVEKILQRYSSRVLVLSCDFLTFGYSRCDFI